MTWDITQMNERCEDIFVRSFESFKDAYEWLKNKYPFMRLVETNKYRQIYQSDVGSPIYVSIWKQEGVQYYEPRGNWPRKYREPDCKNGSAVRETE